MSCERNFEAFGPSRACCAQSGLLLEPALFVSSQRIPQPRSTRAFAAIDRSFLAPGSTYDRLPSIWMRGLGN